MATQKSEICTQVASKLLKSLIIKNDLEETKVVLQDKGLFLSIAHLKTAFISFHNLIKYESSIKSLYKENRESGTLYKDFKVEVDFFAYLRNKFAGHLTEELISKTIEWKPEILISLKERHTPDIILFYNFALLETAINTYVNEDDSHKIFENETDFMYPPNVERFTKRLIETIEKAIVFLETFEAILKNKIEPPTDERSKLDLFIKAGQTDFKYISGKKR